MIISIRNPETAQNQFDQTQKIMDYCFHQVPEEKRTKKHIFSNFIVQSVSLSQLCAAYCLPSEKKMLAASPENQSRSVS